MEFKEASNDYDTDKLGKYFSALCNEANLRNCERAWLVFGVNERHRRVVGTGYRSQQDRLNSLKDQIARGTSPSVSLRNIHVLQTVEGRVVLFEIPAAPRGIPIAWQGHYYARAGDSLAPLSLEKQDTIRAQTARQDWSAQVVPGATLEDLDPDALHAARASFVAKHANRLDANEMLAWPLSIFLDRSLVTQDGQITRTALLLLGKPESSWRLSPHPAQMTWSLEGPERAYEHFGPPFLLATTALYRRIRNVQMRLLPHDELLPIEVAKYDQKAVLEALHNCIAHQDYSRDGRIVVTEWPDRLVLDSEGTFFEGQPLDYVPGHQRPRRYRNTFLAHAMAGLNMIDTMGYGIHEMYQAQARRYFPLPDYDLSESASVRLTLYGGVVDPAYTRLLMQQTRLSWEDVLALDRVQKKLPLPDEVISGLRRKKLIEGRKPHFHVAASVAAATAQRADYIRTRAQDDAFYAKLVTDYLHEFGQANRKDINALLLGKLSEALSLQQRHTKIGSLLTKMRRQGLITNGGSDAVPRWQLTERSESNSHSSKRSNPNSS
ncbi:RNA-binding domain-containing protein [Ottowia flava]|uniref:RNA-binding domain-containing protein n=1 Tax=Ottowia flava TaxID=2675430 RepID=A0ABW4KT64_9BURK|nr:RNA-binding domain-containing protein [Ottowia sp. GY511]